MTITKPRKRRIAADEAHSWARNLRLKNPYAKLVLCMLTLYVNGDGCCFTSIEQLAEDCEFAPETVRRRLIWLEGIGAIVRMPQWRDANGRLNSDGKGKRTTDEIRLLIDIDPEVIEAAAHGESERVEENSMSETSESSHSPTVAANESLAPHPATQQPPHCGGDITSEPEPESSPQPPSGGSVDVEGWKEFESDWQEPIMRQHLAQQVWSALKPDERSLARSAARGYVAHRKSQRKPPNVIGAHLFLRERAAWEGFAKRDPGGARRGDGAFAAGSLEAKAVEALHGIAGRSQAFRTIWKARDGSVTFKVTMTPQLLALAQMPERDVWAKLDYRGARAWEEFLDPFFPHGAVRTHYRAGDAAPWPWPPSVEGKIYTPDAGPPPLGELTDQDAKDFV